MKKLEFLEGKANVDKNPPEFEFLQRKPKEAIKKLILVRSDGCDVGHGMDSSFVASALFFFFWINLLQVLFFCARPLTWHGLSFVKCVE